MCCDRYRSLDSTNQSILLPPSANGPTTCSCSCSIDRLALAFAALPALRASAGRDLAGFSCTQPTRRFIHLQQLFPAQSFASPAHQQQPSASRSFPATHPAACCRSLAEQHTRRKMSANIPNRRGVGVDPAPVCFSSCLLIFPCVAIFSARETLLFPESRQQLTDGHADTAEHVRALTTT